MMSFKKMLPLLGLLILSTLTFIACEQDLLQDEAEFGEIESRDNFRPKKYTAPLCTPREGDTTIRKGCYDIGSDCKKVVYCDKVNDMTNDEYREYYRRNIGD